MRLHVPIVRSDWWPRGAPAVVSESERRYAGGHVAMAAIGGFLMGVLACVWVWLGFM